MSTVQIENRHIGDGHPCFVTFEAGPTHSGLESAKKLVAAAAEANADAIKFQILDPDRLVSDRSIMFEYDVLVDQDTGATETVKTSLYELLASRALSKNEWREVKKEADKHQLAFFATVGFDDEVDLLDDIGCHSIKIASGDVNHHPLIRKAARTGMCIQLDTGSSTLGEIESAIDICLREGNSKIIVHQCPSGYPARLDSINLRVIETLKKMFGFPVAYSDHTPGWEMDVAALAMGANLVEKTITFDRMTRSVEHMFSLEPKDMAQFINVLRDVERAMGTTRRILHDEEITKRARIRRSVHLLEDARAGTKLSELIVDFRRPESGLTPVDFDRLGDCVLAESLDAGVTLDWNHIA